MAQIKDLKLTDTLLTADETKSLVCTLESKTCSELAGKMDRSAAFATVGQLNVSGLTAQDATALTLRVQCNSSPSNHVAVYYNKLQVSTPDTIEEYTFGDGSSGTDVVRFADLDGTGGGGEDPMLPAELEKINNEISKLTTGISQLCKADVTLTGEVNSATSNISSLSSRVSALENGSGGITAGQGLAKSGNTIKFNQRANHSGFEFSDGAVYINTSCPSHPAADARLDNVATDNRGKLVATPAEADRYGTVKMAPEGAFVEACDTAASGMAVASFVRCTLEEYYDKAEVDQIIRGANVDLSSYYTKGQVDAKLGERYTKTEVYNKVEVDNKIAGIAPTVDLSDYYTRSDADATFATKEDLQNAATGDVDLTDYYKKSEADEKFISKDSEWPDHVHDACEVKYGDEIALGTLAEAPSRAVAIGRAASAFSDSISIGGSAVSVLGAIAIGYNAGSSDPSGTVSIGMNAHASDEYPTVIGSTKTGVSTNGVAQDLTPSQIKVSKAGIMTIGGKQVAMLSDVGSGGGESTTITVDEALDVNSTNPVQNKWFALRMGATNANSIQIGCGAKAGIDSYSWDAVAHGDNGYQVAVGVGASAYLQGVAVGYSTRAANKGVAIGYNAYGPGCAVAIGHLSMASNCAVAVGNGARAECKNTVAIGYGVKATESTPIVIGDDDAFADAKISVSKSGVMTIGSKTVAMVGDPQSGGGSDLSNYYTKSEVDETFVNSDAVFTASGGVGLGQGATAGATGVAIGCSTSAGNGGVAIGMGAQVVSSYHIAIGPNVITSSDYPVVIGYGDDGSDNPPGYPNATIKVSKDGVMMVGSKTVAMVGDTPSGGGGGTVVVDADAKELAGSMTDFRLVDGTGAGLRVRSDACGMKFTTLTTDGFVGYNKTLIDKDTFVALVNRVAALEAKHT